MPNINDRCSCRILMTVAHAEYLMTLLMPNIIDRCSCRILMTVAHAEY